jgi:hypothetical protein
MLNAETNNRLAVDAGRAARDEFAHDRRAGRGANTNSADGYTDAHADSDAHGDAHGVIHTNANRDRNRNLHRDQHRDAHTFANADCDRHIYTHRDINSNIDAHRHANVDANGTASHRDDCSELLVLDRAWHRARFRFDFGDDRVFAARTRQETTGSSGASISRQFRFAESDFSDCPQ